MNSRLVTAAASLGAIIVLCSFAGSAIAASQTGELRRQYYFANTGENIPYRLYVPSSYDGTKPFPLVVVLHGSSTTADDVIRAPGLERIAEQKKTILLAPQGYNAFGSYGDIYPVVVTREAASQVDALLAASRPGSNAPKGMTRPKSDQPPAAADDATDVPVNGLTDPLVSRLSEKDTMNVLDMVRHEYNIDPDRIYLMGNSMGAMGASYLAARYPDIWAAVSPSGGPFAAWSYPYFRLREGHIAALFVHGDKDQHANWRWSQVIVERAQKEGVDAKLLVVKGGNHVDAWTKALPEIFDFFLSHRKSERPNGQPRSDIPVANTAQEH
ncbi:MAG TPA: PHB depolymerase family esterase [Terriglobales bacterium]|nr:PHB depolymerase family esterase [Terriglobales bacterium]